MIRWHAGSELDAPEAVECGYPYPPHLDAKDRILGPPMTRAERRKRARRRRGLRRDLVHAAGCTEPMCVVRLVVRDNFAIVNEALAEGIRIPRSIARRWFG